MHLAEQIGQTQLSRIKKKNPKNKKHRQNHLNPPKLWKSSKIPLSGKLRIPVVIDLIFGAQNNVHLF